MPSNTQNPITKSLETLERGFSTDQTPTHNLFDFIFGLINEIIAQQSINESVFFSFEKGFLNNVCLINLCVKTCNCMLYMSFQTRAFIII